MTRPLVVLALLAAPAFADEPKPKCTAADTAKHRADGIAHLSHDENAAALASFERAYACKPDRTLLPRMVLAACKSVNAKQAKHYFATCGRACAALVQRCKTYDITLE